MQKWLNVLLMVEIPGEPRNIVLDGGLHLPMQGEGGLIWSLSNCFGQLISIVLMILISDLAVHNMTTSAYLCSLVIMSHGIMARQWQRMSVEGWLPSAVGPVQRGGQTDRQSK